MTTFGCDEYREVAPDLALGLLAGDERGAAISHLESCGPCRRHLEGLVQAADELLLLAPLVEPEIGFESRVMARLAADGAFSPPGSSSAAAAKRPLTTAPAIHVPRPANRRRAESRGRRVRPRTVGIAAAVAVVAGVTGLAAGLTQGRDAGRTSALRQQAQAANQLAARTVVIPADGGRSMCQLVVFPSIGAQPAHLVIQVDEPGEPPSSYQVLAAPTDGGPAVVVGTITMLDGHGMLTASIPQGTGPVHAVLIVDAPRTIRYRASFESV